jgi:1-deoxy-D-xylulose-5-phosphate reductoisomerase
MVEFVDGSVKAQISPPDMHLPIQYALQFPDRLYNENIRRFDPVATGSLTFEPWDSARYPCFDMALEIAKRGGTWSAALCGADERAVDMFLGGRIGFLEIGPVIRKALNEHRNTTEPDLEDILAAAQWAKEQVRRVVEG